MNRSRFALIVLAIWLGNIGRAQTIAGQVDAFTTDEMGNVYVIRGDVLELYNAKGVSWLRNSVKTFGRITIMDAFYSLKPMIFSPEQGQLAVLDNTLSIQGSVLNLPRNGYPQVVLACMSVQNGFWFFDQQQLALLRVDAQLRKLADTGRLDQLLGLTPMPIAMQEFDSRLYVNDPLNGILVFDLFGTYVKTIPLREVQSFEVRGEALYFMQNGRGQVYDMRSFAITDIPMPPHVDGTVLDLRVERGALYIRTDKGIHIHEVVTTR